MLKPPQVCQLRLCLGGWKRQRQHGTATQRVCSRLGSAVPCKGARDLQTYKLWCVVSIIPCLHCVCRGQIGLRPFCLLQPLLLCVHSLLDCGLFAAATPSDRLKVAWFYRAPSPSCFLGPSEYTKTQNLDQGLGFRVCVLSASDRLQLHSTVDKYWWTGAQPGHAIVRQHQAGMCQGITALCADPSLGVVPQGNPHRLAPRCWAHLQPAPHEKQQYTTQAQPCQKTSLLPAVLHLAMLVGPPPNNLAVQHTCVAGEAW